LGQAVGLQVGLHGVDRGGQAQELAALHAEPGERGLPGGGPGVGGERSAIAAVGLGGGQGGGGIVLEAVLQAGRRADHGRSRVVGRGGVSVEEPAGLGAAGFGVGVGRGGFGEGGGVGRRAGGAREASALDADAGGEVATGAELDEGECHRECLPYVGCCLA
jgi:hypothetical protein